MLALAASASFRRVSMAVAGLCCRRPCGGLAVRQPAGPGGEVHALAGRPCPQGSLPQPVPLGTRVLLRGKGGETRNAQCGLRERIAAGPTRLATPARGAQREKYGWARRVAVAIASSTLARP